MSPVRVALAGLPRGSSQGDDSRTVTSGKNGRASRSRIYLPVRNACDVTACIINDLGVAVFAGLCAGTLGQSGQYLDVN